MRSHLRQAKSILLFLVIACASLAGEQVAQLKPTGFINDYANVIDAESVRQMQYLCDQVDKRAQAQIAVVTVNTLEGSSIESYATRLFRHWGIGPKSNNRGILILLAVQDHKYRIEVGTGLEAVITNRKAAGFGREAVPFLKQFQYGPALKTITRRVTDAIAADAQVTITDAPQPTPAAASYQYSQSSSGSGSGVEAVVIFLLVAAVVCIVLLMVVKGGQGAGFSSGPGYRGYGYGYPVYQNVGGYYNHSNTYLFNGFGGSSSSSSSSSSSDSSSSSSWGGGGGFGGGGDSSGFGGGSSSGSGSSGDYSSSSSDTSSSSSSSSSDFGGGSSDGGGASGSW